MSFYKTPFCDNYWGQINLDKLFSKFYHEKRKSRSASFKINKDNPLVEQIDLKGLFLKKLARESLT